MTRRYATVALVALATTAWVLLTGSLVLSFEVAVVCAVFAWIDVRVGDWPRGGDVGRAVLLMLPLMLLDLGLLWVVYLPLSYLAPELVTSAVFESFSEEAWYLADRSPFANGLLLVSLVVVTPIVEEAIFRGWLLPKVSRRWGVGAGVITTSLIFGLLHGPSAPGATLTGLVLALLYLDTGSLLVPIAAHATVNAIAASCELIGVGPEEDWSGPVLLATFRDLWWMGAIGVMTGAPFIVTFVRRTRGQITSAERGARAISVHDHGRSSERHDGT